MPQAKKTTTPKADVGKTIEVDLSEDFAAADGGLVDVNPNPALPHRDTHTWNANITWPCTACGADPAANAYEPCPGGAVYDPETGVRLP
jgi:hypothetical protein